MSFCNEIKQYLYDNIPVKGCCHDAYVCGIEQRQFETKCDKCDGMFLRGVFASRGYVSEPDKRCELVLHVGGDFRYYVAGVLADHGIQPCISTRGGREILYYKRRDDAEDFLTLIGAEKFSIVMIQEAVMHDLRQEVNRTSNALTANINRSSRASAEQLSAIKKLMDAKEYQKLPPELKEAADIRLDHPEESLEALRPYFANAITKSGIKHRFERIIQIAESI